MDRMSHTSPSKGSENRRPHEHGYSSTVQKLMLLRRALFGEQYLIELVIDAIHAYVMPAHLTASFAA
jgi:hypothetical protein